MEIDRADVVAEVRSVFERYEAALVANDLSVLDELFWHDARTQRFGLSDRQRSFAEVAAAFGRFVASVPSPLCIGALDLDDGRRLPGFLCQPAALDGAREITAFGGWRAYLARAQ